MLQAILHGKLSRDHEQIEDILTSNVFGLLRYMPAVATLEFLSRARLRDQSRVFPPSSGGVVQLLKWDFWPWWSEKDCIGCEPDLVLRLRLNGSRDYLVVVEAKLNAGKSSLPDETEAVRPRDQLAREWDNLRSRAEKDALQPILIYLTSHYAFPRDDVNESIAEYHGKRHGVPVIAWLSWRELIPALERVAPSQMRNDLIALMRRMGMINFDGVRNVARKVAWALAEAPARFEWRRVKPLRGWALA